MYCNLMYTIDTTNIEDIGMTKKIKSEKDDTQTFST